MDEIKEARELAGLSQREMGELMQIPKRTIENWEAGSRKPPAYVKRFILNELKAIKEEKKMAKKYGIYKWYGDVAEAAENLANGMLVDGVDMDPEPVAFFATLEEAKEAFKKYSSCILNDLGKDGFRVEEYSLVELTLDEDGEAVDYETLNTSEYQHHTLWSVDEDGRIRFDEIVNSCFSPEDVEDIVWSNAFNGHYTEDEKEAIVKDVDGTIVKRLPIPEI